MLVSLGHVVSGSEGGGQMTFRMLGPRGINVPNSLVLFSLSGLVLCVLASNSLATDGALHGTRSLAADSYGSQKSNLEILKSRMSRGKEVALLLLQNKPEDTPVDLAGITDHFPSNTGALTQFPFATVVCYSYTQKLSLLISHMVPAKCLVPLQGDSL